MMNGPIGRATIRSGLRALAVLGAALAPPAAAQPVAPVREERWDEAAAKAQAQILMPIIADDVIDGRRQVLRTVPASRDIGLLYQFRLRPQPVRYRPLCEMRTISLSYYFLDRLSGPPISVDTFELLAMKRAGGFGHGDLSSRRQYHELAPAPQSNQEHVDRCAALDVEQGWVDAADDSEIHSVNYWLSSLRNALADRGDMVRLRCLRDRADCAISASTILDVVEAERRQFEMISLHDGTAWAQFFYYDDPAPNAGGETRTVIIESRLGEIVSVTLVYGMFARTAV
jgi:hypothetical protein